MQTPELKPAEQELVDLLTEHQVLDERQINQVLTQREYQWRKLSQTLQGTFCKIAQGQLRLLDYASGEEKAAFSIETGFPDVSEPLLIWIDREGKELGRGQLPLNEVGLLVGPQSSQVLTQNPLDSGFIAQSQQLPVLAGHDLVASPDGRFLALSERQGGQLQIFGLAESARLASLRIRQLGSHKSIHACFTGSDLWITDPENTRLGRVLIPDNIRALSPAAPPQDDLLMLDVLLADTAPDEDEDLQASPDWQIEWQELELGRLGPLLAGPDGKTLYILALSPKLRLISFDCQTLRVQQEVSLAGSPSSLEAGVPTDNLLLLKQLERLQVVYLTRQGQNLRMTQQQFSLRLSLAGELQAYEHLNGWVWWLQAETNPLLRWAEKDLADWIVELGFLSAEYLVYLRQEARHGTLSLEEATPYIVPCGDDAPIDVLMRPAPELDFAPGAESVVYELLLQAAQQLGLSETGPELQQILQQEAASVCEFLKEHYVSLIEIELPQSQFLDLTIARDQLLQLLDQRLGGKMLPWRPGHRCPMCQMLLPNPRLCQHCDFALANADWLARKALMSAEACDELIPGQLLLALPQARRIAFLDAWLQVIAEFEGAQGTESLQPWQEPVHALALPDQNWLICDRGSAQVIELAPTGECVRLLDHRFNQPVLSSFRRSAGQLLDLLVLDQDPNGGKIYAFSREGRLLKRWGPEQGLELKNPRDLHWTWAETFLVTDSAQVLEWDPASGQQIQAWGAKQGLQKPVLARRQPDGGTLIVDAGRGEVLIFNEAQSLSRSFAYWPPADQDPAWVGQGGPERMLVLPNGELLGLGRRYWMLIQPLTGKTRWVQPWTGARRPPHFKQRLQQMADENPAIKALRQLRLLQNLDGLALKHFLEQAEILSFEDGEWVLKPDDPSGSLLFILEGEVNLLKGAEQPVLSTLKAGECFGEVPLVLGETYPAGFQAKGALKVYQLKRSRYKQWVMHTGEVAPLLREQAFTRKALLAQYQSGQLQARMDRVKAQLVAKRLLEIPLFEGFELADLEELAVQMRSLAYMPGQQVFGQDESGDTLYVIARGKVGVYLDGQPQALAELENHQIFGEMSLLEQAPRSATVKSEAYCQLYELSREAFETFDQREPRLRQRLQALIEQRKPQLDAAQLLSETGPEALDQPQAEILALTRVRPARAYALSQFQEKALCLDESGTISWLSSPLARLYRPTRLVVQKEEIWIANTGRDNIVALASSDGRSLPVPELALAQPRSVSPTPDGRLLIADTGNQRLLLVSAQGEMVWEYAAPHEIMSPYYAEATLKGTILFADRELQMVFEIDLLSEGLVWSYGSLLEAGDEANRLNEPSCVRRLANGGTLIADTGNDRLLLFSPVGTLMRSFSGTPAIPLIRPLHLELLDNGEILVYPEGQDEVIRLGLGGQPIWRARLPK